MKVCIAYESKYGNGKKCVEHLQSVVSKKGHDVETFSIHEIKVNSLPQADFYVFSAPTHIGGLPRKMKKFLSNLEIKQEGVKYALMATHMTSKTRVLQIMEGLLQSKNISKVSDGLKIKVTGMKGPLENGYEEKLDAFAKDIFGEK